MISNKEERSEQKTDQLQNKNFSRRTILKALAGIPVLGVFGYEVMKNRSYAREKEKQIMKELGLENLDTPKIIPDLAANKGNRLRVGFIGFGNRANQLVNGLGVMHLSEAESKKKNGILDDWMAQEDLNIDLAGICDVFDLHAQRGLETAKDGLRINGKAGADYPVHRYRTYQEMLADDSIDAVVIATPDHHHARMTVDAIKAGKHVYCEKSIALTEDELNEVYNTVKNSNQVFQLGHQITQNVVFKQAREIIAKDILGKITLIETTTNRNTASGAWIRHLDDEGNPKSGSLETIDWDQWLGNRPKVPFSIDRYYNWTKFFDYDTGMLGQLFSHEYDAVNQLLRIGIPKSAVASGGIYYWKDNREMPDLIQAVFEYPDKELTLMYSGCLSSARQRGRVFMGHDASMELGESVRITADNDSTRYKQKIKEGTIDTNGPMLIISQGSGTIDAVTSATEKYYSSRGLTSTVINGRNVDVTHLHLKEWINCIRNGGTPSSDIEKAFEEGITILMAHKSYIEKRRVEWDPVKRKII
jgi:predicted dehydrogenase